MTQGRYLGSQENTAEAILANWEEIADRSGEFVPSTGFEQYKFEVARARAAL